MDMIEREYQLELERLRTNHPSDEETRKGYEYANERYVAHVSNSLGESGSVIAHYYGLRQAYRQYAEENNITL